MTYLTHCATDFLEAHLGTHDGHLYRPLRQIVIEEKKPGYVSVASKFTDGTLDHRVSVMDLDIYQKAIRSLEQRSKKRGDVYVVGKEEPVSVRIEGTNGMIVAEFGKYDAVSTSIQDTYGIIVTEFGGRPRGGYCQYTLGFFCP
ncbi:hypothetical protein HYU11_02375 [Candidatus Woesearchaeota archaeon]|nr:hypothetical protein [Candidatus Woesearchaeota archaeon]